MNNIIKSFGGKIGYAVIVIALIALAVFVVLPLMPQVHTDVSVVSLSAAISLADGDGGGDGGGDAGGGEGGGNSDSGGGPSTGGDGGGNDSGCCGDGPGAGEGGGNSNPDDTNTDAPDNSPIDNGPNLDVGGPHEDVVLTPAPTCAISASPSSFSHSGGNTNLSWTSNNATAATIDQTIGSVATNGSRSIFVASSKTFTLTVTGPGGSASCSAPVTVAAAPLAPTCTLVASPNSLPFGGGNTILSWTTDNATAVSISEGVGSVVLDGSHLVSVSSGKTFTLTATGPGGSVNCNAAVTVGGAVAPACTLTVSPSAITLGGSSRVNWTSENVSNIVLKKVVNGVESIVEQTTAGTGSFVVIPEVASTHTYKGSFTGAGGTVNCEALLVVNPVADPAPVCALSATPASHGFGGGNSTLNWTTSNADSVTLDNSNGSVALNGSLSVNVQQTVTYILTATKGNKSTQCVQTITVATQTAAPSCDSFTASPNVLTAAGDVVFTWNTSNADSVSINNGVGAVAVDGSTSKNVTSDTTFVLTATKGNQSATCNVFVDINPSETPKLSCDAFSISPSSVSKGNTATMTWNTTNADSVTIDNSIGTVTPDGTQSITVNENKTYVLTAKRGSETVSCNASVSVETGGGGGGGGGGGSNKPVCSAFTASKKTISAGDSVKLSWKTRRGSELKIGPNDVYETTNDDKTDEGSVTVKPTKTTKYTLTVSKGSRKDTCTVEVKVGGFTVLTDRNQLSSLSFTDIPYTGFDAGPFLTGLFYTLLTLWSLAIAYVLAIKRGSVFGFTLPASQAAASNYTFGSMIPHDEYHAHTHVATPAPVHTAAAVAFSAPGATQVKAVHAEVPSNLPTGSYAHQVVTAAHDDEDVDRDEEENENDEEAPEGDMQDAISHLENIAHGHNVLLSSDALRLMIDQSDTTEEASTMLQDLIERAKASYPREDGWIILNRERVMALFPQTTSAAVASIEASPVVEEVGATTLAEAIVTGNTALAYALLGNNPMIAIADAAEALDGVVRARHAGNNTSDMLVRASAHISDEKLKAAVLALVSAIDGTYSDEVAAVRLAVIKALKAIS